MNIQGIPSTGVHNNNSIYQDLEDIDEDYEPTDEELHEYAGYIGMNLPEDQEFLYIAREGLKAPLPDPWKAMVNQVEGISFINYETHQIQKEHPLDEHYRQMFMIEKEKKMQRRGQQQNHMGMNMASNLQTSNIVNPMRQNNEASQVQRVLDEQKKLLEKELQESLEQIDKNFELKKQEILKQNDQELGIERQKWDLFLKEEERKLKIESEKVLDAQISLFKEQLLQEEEKERFKIQKETEAQLRVYEKELEEKFEKEKQLLVESYSRIRKTIEETEKERFDFELEKFRKDQGKSLDSKKGDIEKLKTEKRKIQGEYNEQIEQLRREMEKKLEREKRQMQEQMKAEVEEIEKEEEIKYERKVEQMKREVIQGSQGVGNELEIQQYKEELDEEFQLQTRDYKKLLDSQLQQEEEKLDKKLKRELQDYESMLQDQYDQELKRKQQKIQVSKDNEERELELIKLRIDQLYQDQVESYRKQQQMKYEKERRLFEDEKRKRMQDIQHSIDKLNLPSSDKDKLRQEITTLTQDQKALQSKLSAYEQDLEEQKGKKRQLERDINELNIQLTSNNANKKSSVVDSSHRLQQLREDLVNKESDIKNAQRQYKELLENKYSSSEMADGGRRPQNSSGVGNEGVKKLEEEMREIKEMLKQQQQKGSGSYQRHKGRFQDMLQEVEDIEDKENTSNLGNSDDQQELKDYLAKEKSALKDLQQRIEEDKRIYKQDKKEVDSSLKYSDPTAYRQRTAVLEKVKESIEKKIDKVNDRIAKVKEMEKRINK